MMRPLLWNKKLTVFNKVNSKGVLKWFKTYHDNCFYNKADRRNTSGESALQNDLNTARIACGKRYRPPFNGIFDDALIGYYAIPDDEKHKYFTLNGGDIIILGHVDDEIADNDSGNSLVSKYKDCCFVVKKAVDSSVLPTVPHVYGSDRYNLYGY